MTVIRRPARTVRLDLALLQREVQQLLERLTDVDRADPASDGEWMPSVDVYESREAADRVVQGSIGPIAVELGLPMPDIHEFEVHRVLSA